MISTGVRGSDALDGPSICAGKLAGARAMVRRGGAVHVRAPERAPVLRGVHHLQLLLFPGRSSDTHQGEIEFDLTSLTSERAVIWPPARNARGMGSAQGQVHAPFRSTATGPLRPSGLSKTAPYRGWTLRLWLVERSSLALFTKGQINMLHDDRR